MQSWDFEETKLIILQLGWWEKIWERNRRVKKKEVTGAVDWEEAAMERVRVREEKVKEELGKEEWRVREKGRALWPFERQNGRTLVNGVTIVFILRGTLTKFSLFLFSNFLVSLNFAFCILFYFLFCFARIFSLIKIALKLLDSINQVITLLIF